jgi:Raf kinase inhibitor-like YbhB/YbcL family protein
VLRRLALALLATTVACGSGGTKKAATPVTTTPGAAKITIISQFGEGGPIPKQYTCDGVNQSPPLQFVNVPQDVASLALQVQDIDTPTKFVHWLVYNIDPHTRSLAAGQAPLNGTQATNSFGKKGYGGPCPPAGSKHRYVFTLLALKTEVNVSEEVSPNDLWATLERSDVGAKGELTGTYQRA